MKQCAYYILVFLVFFTSACTRELCDDTCFWPQDGECDDGGPGSLNDYCAFGTDCSDCGTRTE